MGEAGARERAKGGKMNTHHAATDAAGPASDPKYPRRPLRFLNAFANFPPNEAIYEDKYVRLVVPKGWGMQELRAKVAPEITPPLFSEREVHQEKMRHYFGYELHIFRRDPKPHLPEAPWLREARKYIVGYLALGMLAVLALVGFFAVYTNQLWLIAAALGLAGACVFTFSFFSNLLVRFRDNARWPGLMEERATASIERKFPNVDDHVRRVIDRYTDLFLDNNWMFSRLKRLFQFLTIVGFYVAAAPLIYLLLWAHETATLPLAAALGWLLVLTGIGLFGFYGLNDHIYEDKYFQSLQNSAADVSNTIRDRMSAINRQYQLTYAHLTELQGKGEQYHGDRLAEQVPDAELNNHMAFFDTQLLIWLGKRLEYIELHLYNRIHSALTIHAALTVAGFVAYLVIFLLGLLPALLLTGIAGFEVYKVLQGGDQSALPYMAGATALAVFLIAMISFVSFRSFYKDDWNSLKSMEGETSTILESHFDTRNLDGWQTYKKLGLEDHLSGRMQKAMITIRSLYDKIGFSGGQPTR